jgi:ribosome production factor 1
MTRARKVPPARIRLSSMRQPPLPSTHIPSYNNSTTMGSSRQFRIGNKIKRQEQHLKIKKEKENSKRDDRLKRRRHEDKNPEQREARRAKNVPATIDSKRTWDEVDPEEDGEGAGLGKSVDVLRVKRRKVDEEVPVEAGGEDDDSGTLENEDAEEVVEGSAPDDEGGDDDEVDSMLGSDSEDEEDEDEDEDDNNATTKRKPSKSSRQASEAPSEAPSEALSMATDLALTPENLANRFPTLFNPPDDYSPKVLITTSLNSTLHDTAASLTTLFPNSTFVRRSAHAHSYKYSIREISKFASARDYTHVVILNQALHAKVPSGLDIVFLPVGPMFHFSISHFVPGSRLPGHGNPTNHFPELILNGFRTPLGLLTAHLFRSLFPSRPEIQGRQVVTLHNQRDYIFLRRHRYVFRDKRASEKMIQGADGKPVKGVEEIRAGLQELGPRFTMKLRRVDKTIQRAGGLEWEWEAGAEKVRTRFSL